ncbi:hypothetical protein BGX26_007633, partial [Mortierella sp. AD094]
MRENTQTPNEVPENAGNIELLECPEGFKRNVNQENPLPLSYIEDDGQPAVDALRPTTGGIHQNIINTLVTIRAAVDVSHGVSTSIISANEARMSTDHFESLSDPLVPGEKSQCLLDIPTSSCNDDLANIGSTEV